MLHYLWTVTQELFITVTLITLLLANAKLLCGKRGRVIMCAGIAAGLLAAAVRAVMHAIKSTPDVRINLYTFYAGLPIAVMLFIAVVLFLRRGAGMGGRTAVAVLSAALSVDLLFYKAWKIMWAPAEFNTAGNGWLSVDFFLRFVGWALTLILLCVYSRFLYKCTMRVCTDEHLWNDAKGAATGRDGTHVLRLTLALESAAIALVYYGQILRTWRTHRPWRLAFAPEMSFEKDLAMFVGNNMTFFILLTGALAMIPPVVLFFRSFALRGTWDNPAQRRRLKADNRHNRRWAGMVAACLVIAAVNVTAVYAADNRVVEPPSSEEYLVSDDGTQVLVPLEQVNDGNLHAFEMKMESGVSVRWIVIRKPNSAAYGVGLDACDVCGTAGYYQRGDTVVCKKCDVVMNINTIGLAGGCNPIPLAFKVDGGNIVIPMDALNAAEKEFK
ncbi:MAG: DUF2318 domain-containing protein [Clostridiales bacterium]|nr:DUF2318 domain-containing protein [Clostridiales bacterium]